MKGNSDGPLLTYQTLILLVGVRVFNFNSILKKGRLSLLSWGARESSPVSLSAVHLHISKALFSLDPDNLQLHCFLGLGALFFLSSRPTM